MKILKNIIEYKAADALYKAADIGIKVTNKAIDRLDKSIKEDKKKEEEKIKNFFETNPEHCHLIISEELYRQKKRYNRQRVQHKHKKTYYVYGPNQQVRYIVKGELLFLKHHLHIYDSSGENQLATMKEALIAIRSPLDMESQPKDFIIEIGGEKIGKVRTRWGFTKKKFDITFNDWTVENDYFCKTYKVFDKYENVKMIATRKLSYINHVYYLDITDPKNELACLLILLALDCSYMTKKEENKRR